MMSWINKLLRKRRIRDIFCFCLVACCAINGFLVFGCRSCNYETELSGAEEWLLKNSFLQHRAIHNKNTPTSAPLRTILSNSNRNAKIKVVVWPENQQSAEYIHIYNDGIQKSPFLELANASDFTDLNRTIWMGMAYIGRRYSDEDNYKDWCDDFFKPLVKAQESCLRQQQTSCFWHVYMINYHDWVDEDTHCPEIEAMMKDTKGADPNQEYFHYYQRSIAVDREFNEDTQWIDPGKLLDEYHHTSTEPGSMVHFPSLNLTANLPRHGRLNFPVRSDIVQSLEKIVQQNYSHDSASIEEHDRPFDLAHFWGLHKKDWEHDESYPYFRLRVSHLLDNYCTTSTNLKCFIGVAGPRGRTGRRKSGHAYISQMLQTKMVVVTQRDEWEDHYRLMEALVSGALVLTDQMWSLPQGYKDGQSMVLFRSANELLQKVNYYLQHPSKRIVIAKAGRKLALEQHRSWHRMEQVVFGRVLTTPELSDLVQLPNIVEEDDDDGNDNEEEPAVPKLAANTAKRR